MGEEHPEIGTQLRGTRKMRRISLAKLARISGISRRHLAVAESGGNISVSILKKAMAALQMTTISLGEFTAGVGLRGISAAAVLEVADQLEQSVAVQQQAIATLRAYAEGGTTSDLNARATTLIRQVTSRIKRAKDRSQFEAVEGALRKAISESESQPPSTRKRA